MIVYFLSLDLNTWEDERRTFQRRSASETTYRMRDELVRSWWSLVDSL